MGCSVRLWLVQTHPEYHEAALLAAHYLWVFAPIMKHELNVYAWVFQSKQLQDWWGNKRCCCKQAQSGWSFFVKYIVVREECYQDPPRIRIHFDCLLLQATLSPPTTGKMLKGLLICYSVALFTFFSVSITGYWAFGNSAQGIIFSSMEPFVPKWLYILGNALACVQLIVTTAVSFYLSTQDIYKCLWCRCSNNLNATLLFLSWTGLLSTHVCKIWRAGGRCESRPVFAS